MKSSMEPIDIACQQVMAEDSSVSSVQWTIMPACHAATFTPQFLLERYLAYLRQATWSLVRPTPTAEGIEFRLLSTSASILTFTRPAVTVHGNSSSISLAISGGWLVQRDQCSRGQMSLSCEPAGEGVKVTLFLSDYCPLLLGHYRTSAARKLLYRLTQGFIHRRVTIRFLGRLYSEAAGKNVCVRVVKVDTMAGEEI